VTFAGRTSMVEYEKEIIVGFLKEIDHGKFG
jgi:hypothetical protein